MPRIHVDIPLQFAGEAGSPVSLPARAARHVQVLRLQPGDAVTLFDGSGSEWAATVSRMGRSDVDVIVGRQHAVDRELPIAVTLALGMPANERMDTLIEKATELGAAGFVPLVTERSVLRLAGERAERKAEHWRGVAQAACEQSGRTRLPAVAAVSNLQPWLRSLPQMAASETRWLLSLRDAEPMSTRLDAARNKLRAQAASLLVLSGPEGGFTESEERAAMEQGFESTSLGPRVLRSDTAPLAVLAHVGLWLAARSHDQA